MLSSLLVAEHEVHFEVTYGYSTFFVVMALLLSIFFGYFLHKFHFYYLPESAGAVIVGFLIGLLLVCTGAVEAEVLEFSSETFFFVLLPPIILEAGYTLETGPFFRNFGAIVLLAVIGSVVASFLTGLGIYAGVENGWFTGWHGANFMQCLLFGTVLSAVDPIATLAILGAKDVGAPIMLYSLVFGESVLNDAVIIVLFHAITPFSSGEELTGKAIGEALASFLSIAFGSIGIGLAWGFLGSFVFKTAKLLKEMPEAEFLVVFLMSYGSYSVANWAAMSGIMAIFTCGITLGRYAFHAASKTAQWSTTFGFKALASAADMFVFAYLGLQFAISLQIHGADASFRWDAPLIFWILFCLVVARAIVTFSLCGLANLFRSVKIPFKMQIVMWFGGLRGAIAFALALVFPTGGCDSEHHEGAEGGEPVECVDENNLPVVTTTTLAIVLITTFVFGGLTEPLVSALGLKGDGDDGEKDEPPELKGCSRAMQRFDENYLQRFFGATKEEIRFDEEKSPINAQEKQERRNSDIQMSTRRNTFVHPNYAAVRKSVVGYPSAEKASQRIPESNVGAIGRYQSD